MVELKISEALASFLPIQDDAKNAELEQNILVHGILDPIKVWKGQDVIVDGHRRYAVAKKHDLRFNVVELEFEDIADVMEWMIDNQDVRRNWTDHQKTYCLGAAMNAKKQRHGGQRPKAKKEGGDQEAGSGSDKTAREIAEAEGVSTSTVKRAAIVAANVDLLSNEYPSFKTIFLNGSFRINPKEIEALVEMNKRDRSKVFRRILSGDFDNYRKALDDAFPVEEEASPSADAQSDAGEGDIVEVRDSLGKVIKDKELQEVFGEADKYDEELKILRAARTRIRKLVKGPAGATTPYQEVDASFNHLITELEGRKPYTVCSACSGDGKIKQAGKKAKRCHVCDGRAWIDKIHYDHVVVEDSQENKEESAEA